MDLKVLPVPVHPQGGEECCEPILKMARELLDFILEGDHIHDVTLAPIHRAGQAISRRMGMEISRGDR